MATAVAQRAADPALTERLAAEVDHAVQRALKGIDLLCAPPPAVGTPPKPYCTGEERWSEKVDREFYGSPVMADSRIYVTSKGGVTSVFEATPEKFALLGQNQLGDESFSTPAICDNRLYLRSAKTSPTRQEFLWCVGE